MELNIPNTMRFFRTLNFIRFTFFFTLLWQVSAAQQSPLLSQFNFAPGLYNPSYVGQYPNLTIGAAFRGQWIGVDGAPSTQVIMVDKAIDRVGLGFQLRNDKAGTLGITDLNGAYSYRIPLASNLSLKGGLSVSVSNWRNDFSKLRLDDTDDPQFLTKVNRWLPNFGAGIQIIHPQWNIGLGVPRLLEFNFNDDVESIAAQTFRHFYFNAGANFLVLDDQLSIQPQMVLTSATWLNGTRKSPTDRVGAPTSADFGLNMVVNSHWKGGLLWRSALERSRSSQHSLGIVAGWVSPNGTNITAVYEFPINAIQKVSKTSVELLLTYALNPRTARITPPVPPTPVPPTPTPTPAKPNPPTPPVAKLDDPEYVNKIEGIVFDMVNGLPTEGARVTISNNCGNDLPPAVITTADGRYSFTLKKGCCYTVTAQRDGRKPANSSQLCVQNSPEDQILRADLDLRQ